MVKGTLISPSVNLSTLPETITFVSLNFMFLNSEGFSNFKASVKSFFMSFKINGSKGKFFMSLISDAGPEIRIESGLMVIEHC